MRIKLLKGWMSHLAGTVLDVGGGVADILIKRHVAKPVLKRGRPSQKDKMLRPVEKIEAHEHQVQCK